MTAHPLPFEISMLAWAIALVIFQIVLQAASQFPFVSIGFLMGPRDSAATIDNKYVGRINRALHNILATFPLFAAASLAVVVAGRTSATTAHGAEMYVWARVLYLPVYIAGIPVLRTLVWTASIVAIVWLMEPLFA
ncbi:MAG: MAPEG family protein [Hyphomicrobiales bacterium]|nr:MAPEG family protein [Hyphomicrobiales bacterium]